jgi:hypothetical protein
MKKTYQTLERPPNPTDNDFTIWISNYMDKQLAENIINFENINIAAHSYCKEKLINNNLQ